MNFLPPTRPHRDPEATDSADTTPGRLPQPLPTIVDAAAALRAGRTTCTALTRAALDTAAAVDERWGVFLCRYHDMAEAAAAARDDEFESGHDRGVLHGIPLAVKDMISTAEGPTTAQSLVHDPGSLTGDAPVVARLRAAGMVVVGKTATMEFAVGPPDTTAPFPLPRHPWSPAYWTGGSSSGSASAVASGMALAALGTDTGGSVRIPAAMCGITGLKPTFGLVPKAGLVPLGYSLDHVGPMARTAYDCALLLEAMAGPHPDDPTSVDRPVPKFTAALSGNLTGMRIGVDLLSHYPSPADPALTATFDSAVAVLAELGAEIVDVQLPHYAELTEVYNVTMAAEAGAYHAPDLQNRWHDYADATRRVLASSIFYTASDYVQAQRIRAVGQRALRGLFSAVDLVVTPTTSVPAPLISELDAYYSTEGLRALNTQYWNAVGNPALTVPMGLADNGLPLGLQIAGPPFSDATVLRAGDAYQRMTAWHRGPLVADTR